MEQTVEGQCDDGMQRDCFKGQRKVVVKEGEEGKVEPEWDATDAINSALDYAHVKVR